jgi:hypothetical protein
MGQILHGSARKTEADRRAIQHSQQSLRALTNRHGINQKTVAKCKKRAEYGVSYGWQARLWWSDVTPNVHPAAI